MVLIEFGGDVNEAVDVDCGPLMTACSGSVAMVEFLLDIGADPNRIKKGYLYPLLKAVQGGHLGIIEALLSHGADVHKNDGEVFAKAVWKGPKVLDRLFEVPMTGDERQQSLRRALQEAAYALHMESFDWLVAKGAAILDVGGKYGSVLQACVSNQYAYQAADINNKKLILKILLENGGVDVNMIDAAGSNQAPALMIALEASSKITTTLLLDAGANINFGGASALHTPLQAACRRRWYEIIERLVKAGADVNAKGGTYGSALHAAVYTHNARAIELLLEHGAKSSCLNEILGKYGSVMQAAAKENAIRSGGFLRGSPTVRIMELLLQHGADVHARGGKYGCALQMAAKSNNLQGVRWLLSKGADPTVEIPGSKYGSALNAAREKKHWAIITCLEKWQRRRSA